MGNITGMTRGGIEWEPAFIVDLNQANCIGCGRCLEVCPSGAIAATDTGRAIVDLSRCGASGKCVVVCPSEALLMSGRVMTSDEVMREILKDEVFYRRSSGGVTLGGGEPTAQPEFAGDILRKCRERGIHTAIETCGYSSWETMESILKYTQLVYLDIKHIDPAEHVKLTGKRNGLTALAFRKMANKIKSLFILLSKIFFNFFNSTIRFHC